LRKSKRNPREVAEIVAIQALSFVAGDPERLASVLDFVMRDDATVKAFAEASQLHPTNVAAAHQALSDPEWERDVP
jgi:hypothetical protein